MTAFALALLVAVVVAAVGALLRFAFAMSRLDGIVITYVLAEAAKKILYIVAGYADKSFSYVISAPLILAAIWWYRNRLPVSEIQAPLTWLLIWIGSIAFFTWLNPAGNLIALSAYAVIWLWITAASGALGYPGKWTYRVLCLAVAWAAVNQIWGPDPLWTAYRHVADPVSIGARYLSDAGYTGSLFSSPSELGNFVLAATALLAGLEKMPRGLPLISIAGALLSGSRYVLFGVMIFWIVWIFFKVFKKVKVKPSYAIAIIITYPFIQDIIGTWILRNPITIHTEEELIRRLTTIGTMEARVGFSEALISVLPQYWINGVGMWDMFSRDANISDDRHNIILTMIIRGGIFALLSYFLFVWYHLRKFTELDNKYKRSAMAYLIAVLIMSMGGPQAQNNWFFLTTGTFFYIANFMSVKREERYELP
ncbi:MAG: hypothetical protein RMK61_01530 [Bacteroidota bacterium]|nr:hypothetical protein [Bacteroidota bacterium]